MSKDDLVQAITETNLSPNGQLHSVPTLARPLEDYNEGMGPVLWWRFPISEAPYLGSPLDCGQTVEVEVRHYGAGEGDEEPAPGLLVAVKKTIHRHRVGGWPGYHTHFTPLPASPQRSVDRPVVPNDGDQRESS